MHIFGLHWLDFSIIILILIVLWLGKFYQFFLNFGTSTNADQAVIVSREVYRQGIGGMWIQYLVLFLTPFYWFTTCFFRRVRLVTIGDFFSERFRSKFLGAAFAVFTLVMAFIGNGGGYMVAGKTMMALTPKSPAKYKAQEKLSVDLFREFRGLKEALPRGLTALEQKRYDELNDRYKRGELRAFVSYTNPFSIYIIYSVVVAIYTIMGGFLAAAITDVIQGFLITTFSLLLIPSGLIKIENLLDLFKYFISIPAIFGAAIWLGFIWRRLSKWAVIIQVFICFAIYALIPNLFQSMEWARTHKVFLKETRPQVIQITTTALREDVEAGRAVGVGQKRPGSIFCQNPYACPAIGVIIFLLWLMVTIK
jgi:hypothetical protein